MCTACTLSIGLYILLDSVDAHVFHVESELGKPEFKPDYTARHSIRRQVRPLGLCSRLGSDR
jgi:hypothetical protein